MRAQQFALDAEDIAVAAAEVIDGFDAGMLLDELAGDLRAHARAGARAVGGAAEAGDGLRRYTRVGLRGGKWSEGSPAPTRAGGPRPRALQQ